MLFLFLQFSICIGGEPGTGNCLGNTTDSESCNTRLCTPCLRFHNVLDDELCQRNTLAQYCVTFFAYMRENCALACCEAGEISKFMN